MALDYLAFHRIVQLIQKELLQGKITKIYQISNEEFLFEIRNYGKNYHLLISTYPTMPYINLIENKPKTISIHTPLVLLLRKHLENGKIIRIEQQNDDRIVLFEISSFDEYFQNSTKKLYVELIGRASNLILTNQENMILDCLKKIPVQYQQLRTLLPNVTYVLPEKPLLQKLPQSIENELEFRQCTLQELKNFIHQSEQIYITENETKKDFHFFPFLSLKGKSQNYPWNVGIETYFSLSLQSERQRQRIASVDKVVKLELKKNKKKLDKLAQDFHQAQNAKEYQYYGDMLLTYGQEIQKITNPLPLFDPETNQLVAIPMDIRYNLFKNASLYYKKYQKAKVAQEKIQQQIALTKTQIDYLESIAFYIKEADEISMKQIEEELIEQGLLRKKANYSSKNKKKIEKKYMPLQYQLDEIKIAVGENNLQNEYLTFKMAHKNHYFFHTQQFHGAHVIIFTDTLNEKLIRTAANLAALHSEAKDSSSVAIDYTQVKNVKKIPGGKPGKVLINKQKTIYIDPNVELLKDLKILS